MAVDARLREALKKKLGGISDRHLNRLISERAAQLMLPREQAAIALAADAGVSISRYADPDDLAAIRHARSGNPSPPMAAPVASDVSSRPARSPKATASVKSAARTPRPRNTKKVFVVHGRDEDRRRAMYAFLRSLGLQPLEWSSAVRESGSASPYIGQVLDAAFAAVRAVVVLLTPDDLVRLRDDLLKRSDPPFEKRLTGQARPNVLFEAGLAFGRHPDQTVLVEIGDMRPFSDVAGRHVVRLNNSAEARTDLANRLSAAGCDVDLSGKDWLSEGDFS